MNKTLSKHLLSSITITALALSNGGCDSNSKPATTTTNKPTDKVTTYWQDVAPIMYQYCGTCHVEGGVAPFVLTNYEATKKWSHQAHHEMAERSMPPWLVTDDGSCGKFRHSRWLPAEKITVFNDWINDGMLEGTPRSDLKVAVLPTLSNATSYKTPKFTPEIEGGALAAYDEYRCFLVDPNLSKDQFVTGYDVHPSNAPLVHHAIIFSIDPNALARNGKTNAQQVAALEAESPTREGWSCFGAAGEGIDIKGIPVSWAPGQGAVNFPETTGLRIGVDDLLVLQVHYNMADSSLIGQSDQTEFQVHYEDSVQNEGFSILPDKFLDSLATGNPDVLAPGLDAVDYSWELPLDRYLAASPNKKLDLYGALPHMHEKGRKMAVTLQHADNTEECLADVQNWDFEWQLYYFYEKPFEITAGDKIKTTCTYDTRNETDPVLPGWGTRNEMCLFGTFLVPK